MLRRVAITGLGAVTPVGNNVESTWQALLAGRSGIGPITTFDATTFPVRIAGMVKDFDVDAFVPDRNARRHLSRAAGFGVAAAAVSPVSGANFPRPWNLSGLAIAG